MKKNNLFSQFSLFGICLLLLANPSCKIDDAISNPPTQPGVILATPYKTTHVIVVIMDGARYSECWGDTTHQHIPFLANTMAPNGVVCTHFFNNGATLTNPGHSAITTGNYQDINNAGQEIPLNPSMFNYYLKASGKKPDACWVIASKDKLQVLNNCLDNTWKDTYQPMTDCGNNGISSGYRHDTITLKNTLNILKNYHPNLVLINFREPDYSAHGADSLGYIKGIENDDTYIRKIWELIQSDPGFKDQTMLIVTNDHGRHLDGVSNGYISHGDGCYGCKHINFFAYGPDLKKGSILSTTYEQIDISATIAVLLGFKMPSSDGKVMWDLLNKN